MEYPETIDALIVGAGPSGLIMAYELARHGAKIRIIEKLPQQTKESRALAIHARTLELLEYIGIVDEFLSSGSKLDAIEISKNLSDPLLRLDTDKIKSKYQFVLTLPQYKTEKIISDKLKKLGITIERSTELLELKQYHVIQSTVKNKKGTKEIIQSKYIIACDGAHSTCRQLSGIKFNGEAYSSQWVLADTHFKENIIQKEGKIIFSNYGLLALFPIKGNYARIIANYKTDLPQEESEKKLTQRFFQKLINDRLNTKLTIEKTEWTSAFHISHHIADTNFKKNLFLVGDSAHIHSPAGGQGMNAGIHDAISLAWKISLVLRNKAHKTLLESHTERIKIIQRIIKLSHYLTKIASLENPILLFMRNFFLKQLNRCEHQKAKLINHLSQVTHNYHHSTIVTDKWSGPTNEYKAGDFLGNIEILESNKVKKLNKIIDTRKHCLLIFGNNEEIQKIHAITNRDFTSFIDTIKIGENYTLSEETLQKLGITTESHSIYLIRPDGYIAFRNSPATLENFISYIHKIFV